MRTSQVIYGTTILALFFALCTLPFLYVTVSIKATGMIKHSFEKIELFAPASGRLFQLNLSDNQQVTKGEILLVIDTTLINQQASLLSRQIALLNKQLHDIKQLIGMVGLTILPENYTPKTGLYQASWRQHAAQMKLAINTKQQVAQIFQRYKILYHKKVVTKAEFEMHKFNHDEAALNEQMVIEKYKSELQNDASQRQKELQNLLNQKAQLDNQHRQFILKAPINGSVQNLIGLQEGSYINEQQKIGDISANGELFAYCYLKSSAIALIKIGQNVRLQIEAFNYNQWGMLTARVIDISDDVIMLNQALYYKIKCKIDQNFLQLKNGFKGVIKKGMAFIANFTIARRSLYQLLADNVNDWVN